MKKHTPWLLLAFFITSCDTSTVFKTQLPFLNSSMNAFPDEINGTYVFMEDSIHRQLLASGLSSSAFIELTRNLDTTQFFSYAHVLTKDKTGSILNYSLVMMLTDSMLNAGEFMNDTDTLYWNKIHDNLIEFKVKDNSTGKDTNYLLPFWKEGDFCLTNDFSITDEISNNHYSTFELTERFEDSPIQNGSPDWMSRIVVKKQGKYYYKIEQEDSLFIITQYAFTPDGFTETIVPEVIVPEDSTTVLADSAKTVLKNIRKISHALISGRKVVFDPEEKELEGLFASAWSSKRHYVRISQPYDNGKVQIREKYLTVFLGLLSLTLFILLLKNKKRNNINR